MSSDIPGRKTSSTTIAFPRAGLDLLGAFSDEKDVHRFLVSPSSPCFDGHFEGLPVLPGVAHVAMAVAACARRSGRDLVLTGARDLRFQHPLGPGDEVDVVLNEGSLPGSTRFEIHRGREVASRGLLVFASSRDDRQV